MTTVASHVPFADLCHLCETVSKKKGKDKQKPLQGFVAQWRKFHGELHKDDPQTTDSFFPAMRLLLPQCERERAAYGIKETTLAKLYISILCLDNNSADAQKLLNYRSPKTSKAEVCDFASVAFFILQKRCPSQGNLKIYDINYHLDNISTSKAAKNNDEAKKSLQYLLRNTSALEQKWLIRMILKDMKMGISENTVLKAFHIDAVDVYNVTNSLEKVCVKLRDPNVRLHEIEISVFTPFRPMLGEQIQPEKVEKNMQNQSFFIETKFDGERVQIHKQGNQYKYFSRNGHDVTEVYGDTPLIGRLTPYIASAFKLHVTSCILDGEMVIYSSKLKCIVSKGENPSVQALEPDGEYHPCFCAFDMLLLNDKVLSNIPLSERTSCLKDALVPIESKILIAEQKSATTNQEVADALNEAIDNRQEGIMIKSASSTYRPNARKGGGWFKVKPDYIDNLMDELDLLIVGGYFGEGRRGNKISHFLLGIADHIFSEQDCKFQTVAKVGSGYTTQELDELLVKLMPHWQVYNPKKPPSQILIGSGRKERPEVWIEPKNSQIVQVRAAEITRSERFATNYTLRFPRVQKIRYDKSWNECMTLQDFTNLRQQSEGRLANRYELPVNAEEPSPKKARKTQPEHTITVAPQFRPADVSDVQQASELLVGKEMCVISASLQNKQLLEKSIVEHGGKFVQNPGPATFCVVADKLTIKVNNIIRTDQYDVVKDSWLKSCIQKNELIPWTPDDMFHSIPETLQKLRQDYDEYDDSYTVDISSDGLRQVFANISSEEWKSKSLEPKEIADIEFRYFSQSSLYGLFRICCVYLDDKRNIGETNTVIENNNLKLTASKLILYGADIRKEIDVNVTHVIVHSKDKARLEEIKALSRSRNQNRFHIVTEKWVDRCIKHKNLLQEKEFMPI